MIEGLGERLQKQRQLLRLSQEDVAKTLNISASVVSNYESGSRTPSLHAIIALSNLYRCSTDYLLGIDKSSNSVIDVSMLTDEQQKLLKLLLATIEK